MRVWSSCARVLQVNHHADTDLGHYYVYERVGYNLEANHDWPSERHHK